MPELDDYFVNHARARRLPWSIYHAPLEASLGEFLEGVAAARPAGRVLVVGCGLMHELDLAPRGLCYTVVDIDARAVDQVMARQDPRIVAAQVVRPEGDLSELHATFDAIYAKEVIEHIVPWQRYLDGLLRALEPGGRVWLSTPNYGEPWLPLLESTVLELVARRSGYSRKHLHPTRFSRARLAAALSGAGFRDVTVRPISCHLALVATGTR